MLSFTFIIISIVRDVQSINLDRFDDDSTLVVQRDRERERVAAAETERERGVCIVIQQGRR